MTRILGIDPGSRITGYGVIDTDGQRSRHVTSGSIRLQDGSLPQRLQAIFEGVTDIVHTYQPEEMAIEIVFMNRNADSALKLGQARGAAIVAGVNAALPVYEFTATQIKQAVVGAGHAAKNQVQHMMRVLLGLDHTPDADAADALAVAICHSHHRHGLARMTAARLRYRGRTL